MRKTGISCYLMFGSIVILSIQAFPVAAEQTQSTTGSVQRTTIARLDFKVNIEKWVFFGIGDGTSTSTSFPAASSNINSATLAVTPSGTFTNGNSLGISWNGSPPTMTGSSAGLPVQITSNSGAVEVSATVHTSLTEAGSGAILPFSQVGISSSDANFPAPVIPDSGSGVAVAIPGSHSGGYVTKRNAIWTFSVSSPAAVPAGSFSGRVTFTAVVL